jgi:hypothetical protein
MLMLQSAQDLFTLPVGNYITSLDGGLQNMIKVNVLLQGVKAGIASSFLELITLDIAP